jgi:hypothetical protein
VARIELGADRIVVRLGRFERLGALVAGDPSVPRAAVRAVRVSHRPFRELRGIRAPGTGFPGAIALGTWRRRRGKDFAAVYGKRPAVVVELEGAEWCRLVVSCDDAEEIARSLRRP